MPTSAEIETIYRERSRSVFATLSRLVGDLELAEDALHDAFVAALEQWPSSGIPANPHAWLVTTGRFKAIDAIRKRARSDVSLLHVAEQLDRSATAEIELADETVRDDQLRLVFTCCHPALAQESQVALTLREVCGLATEEIAKAFLVPSATLAQRIVRSKSKIRDAKIPFEVPSPHELPSRLNGVLQVIYLVYNEGYSASSGDHVVRTDLSEEAIRLGRHLHRLLPAPEVAGLLALMLIQESRRKARMSASGDLVLLEDQDRSLWNREMIAEGVRLVEGAIRTRQFGAYTIQAAIAALHAEAPSASETDWAEVVGLYDLLLRFVPSPVVELNRAVAVAMRGDLDEGIATVKSILDQGNLQDYHLAHATLADFYRRKGDVGAAKAAYERALALVEQEPERRFLERRLKELSRQK